MRTIRRLLVALSVVVLGWMATPAHAQNYPLNVVGRTPGATVLIPYFEVNLAKADGMTTVFSINNASATAVLAHVNVMTDLGVLALGFNVYLTGYDIQTINMRDIINGIMPQTASAGQDPQDKISPHGQVSQDINFASCSGILPTPNLPSNYTTHLKNSLSGKGTTFYGGNCVGLNYGDSVARGYITIDTVNACALVDPASPGYLPYLTFQNVLWADAYFLDTRNKVSRAAPVVSVVANNVDPLVSTPGNYTFILRASRDVPRRLMHPRHTIGVRIPDHTVPLALLAELGEPILSSTLILPDHGVALNDAEEIREHLDHQLDLHHRPRPRRRHRR